MTRSKLQAVYDYLTQPPAQGGVGLLTEDQLEVWESESKTKTNNTFDGQSSELFKIRTYQCNLLISDLKPTQDRDQIEFALLWWLNLYEPQHPDNVDRLATDADIKDRTVTNLWIGFLLTEKTRLKDGKVELCMKPVTLENPIYSGLVVLQDLNTGEEQVLGTLADETPTAT